MEGKGRGMINKECRIATIAKWTQLKEAEVEEARKKHTEDMQKISSVLGIPASPATGK
jgi:hypothetical protein